MDNSISSDKFMALSNGKQWLRACIVQGHRLLKVSQYQNSLETHSNRKDFINSSQQRELLDEKRRIEEYFFIIAVNKAREWLKEVANLYQEFKPYKTNFDNNAPLAKEVRDMREHEIGDRSYLKGMGMKQDKFLRNAGKKSGEIVADATAAIINEGEYLIGGRLKVQQVISYSEKIYPKIVDFFQQELLKGTFS